MVHWLTKVHACVELKFVIMTPDCFATQQVARVLAASFLIALLKMAVSPIPMNARVAPRFAMPPLGCFATQPQTKGIKTTWVNAVLPRKDGLFEHSLVDARI